MYINFTSIKKTTTKKEEKETETGAVLGGEEARVCSGRRGRRSPAPAGPPRQRRLTLFSRKARPAARQLHASSGLLTGSAGHSHSAPPHWGGSLPISLVSTERSSPGLKCFKEVFPGKDETALHASQNFVVSSACTNMYPVRGLEPCAASTRALKPDPLLCLVS